MTATRRVLMVSQHRYAPPQMAPQFPSHPTLERNVSELLAHGVEIDLACITPRVCIGRRSSDRTGIRLYGIPMRPRRFPALWYLVQYATFFLWALIIVSILGLMRRYDIVQVDTLPDILVFSTIVPRARGTPVVLFVYDLMPEMTAVRFGANGDSLPVRLVAAVERAATRFADRVITVTDRFRRIMVSRGLDDRKVVLVANSHPLSDLPPLSSSPSREGPGMGTSSPILILPTTLIERYGAHVAILAMDKLRANWPDLRLRILGEGEDRPRLIAMVQRLGLGNRVSFSAGFVPWRQCMEEVRRATLGVVPITAEAYGDLILPNKVFEFVFLGIPVVASRLSGIRDHLPDDAVAYFEPGDAAGLATSVDRLLKDPEAARRQATRAKEAMAELAWEHASRKYLEALGVTPSNPPPRLRGRVGTVGLSDLARD